MTFRNAARVATVLALGLAVSTARADVVLKTVEYKQGDTVLEGLLAYDTAGPAKRPGVLVVHDWYGVGAHMKQCVEQLARMGYVAFAADIYGKGVRPANAKDAGATAGPYFKDRNLLRTRVLAGFQELLKQPNVDASRIAAIGFCFGGTTVLELARSGAAVVGTVVFHGNLSTPTPADAKNIKGKVLALHGADDPFVPPEQVKAFEDEMRAGGVDWQLNIYSDAVHAFMVPDAGNDKSKGAAYNPRVERRAWKAMEDFFAEVFAR